MKRVILSCGAIAILSSGILIANNFVQASSKNYEQVKTTNKAKVPAKVLKTSENNLAIKTALHDFSNLNEFNKYFENSNMGNKFVDGNELLDDQWMIPDLSNLGSEDGGKSHSWSISLSKEQATEQEKAQMKNKEMVMKTSDGASVKEIRKALVDRDNNR